jgi:hypothetical protein
MNIVIGDGRNEFEGSREKDVHILSSRRFD